MDKEEFYLQMYYRALDANNDELIDYYGHKYSKEVTKREAKLLEKVLLGILVVTILSPWIVWWLGPR